MRYIAVFCFLLSSCSQVFYYPSNERLGNPEEIGLEPEEFFFQSQGRKLWAWHFKSPNPKGLVLHFHGNAQNMTTHFIFSAWMSRAGWDVMTFDYSGYGLSEGEPSQEALYQDALAALDEARRRSKNKRLVVFAQSLGVAVASRALVDWPGQAQLDGLILDSGFYSYQTIARQKMAESWVTWLFQPLAWLLISDEYAPEELLEKLQVKKILIIHSKDDPVVPYAQSLGIYEKLKSRASFWSQDQGGHIGTMSGPNDHWRKKLLQWLD